MVVDDRYVQYIIIRAHRYIYSILHTMLAFQCDIYFGVIDYQSLNRLAIVLCNLFGLPSFIISDDGEAIPATGSSHKEA